jgi:translation initiation factor 2 subunit 1
MKFSGWPESGELVVGEIEEIEDFGVFVDLTEYEDKEGLVHVSEVASGWIKNVRDHVNEGQTVVAKVLDVDEDSQQIDLSLKDVNEHQRSDKIQEWKNEQKADNWLELAFGEDLDDETYTSIANALLADFGSLYDGFEQAAIHGHEALEESDLDDDEIDAIVETARENVSVPYVNVTGYVDLESPSPDGVDDVRDALQMAEGNGEVLRGGRTRSDLRRLTGVPNQSAGAQLQDRRARTRGECTASDRFDRGPRWLRKLSSRAPHRRRVVTARDTREIGHSRLLGLGDSPRPSGVYPQ